MKPLLAPSIILCCSYELMFLNDQEVAEIAEWDDEQIEYIKEKVTEEGKLEDLKKGKPPEQVYLLPKFLAKYNIARCKVF